jgi:hypothetical protein
MAQRMKCGPGAPSSILSRASAGASAIALGLLAGGCVSADEQADQQAGEVHQTYGTTENAVYQTYGVHNPPGVSPCANRDCRYPRTAGQPADPLYPEFWTSRWTMYRIFNNYENNPPPYNGRPPASLVAGRDYEISQGATYYDSTWRGASGEGAMMEHYERRCLPIFPIRNDFTCSFISLGNTAYFVTYDQDRPAGMPRVCLFSGWNHPPRRDFVSHLPFSADDSARLGDRAQAYSFWVNVSDGRPIQTGASPDRTNVPAILFGYAFAPASASPGAPLQPSSFYFSGYPVAPANAPIVSQNYTDWAAVRPDPARTWDQVSGLDPATLPRCHLFDPQTDGLLQGETAPRHPTWGHIGRWRGQ